LVLVLALSSALAACVLGASQRRVSAVSTFQSERYSTTPGAFGTAVLEERGSEQIFSVTINNLGGVSNGPSGSFGVFLSPANNSNTLAYLVGPMNLQGSNGMWRLQYVGEGAAPAQLAQLGVTNLDDLVGMYLLIANPGTNVIINGLTYETIYSVLFTKIPEFTTKSKAPHFNRKSKLTTISVPPNPHEKGWIKTVYSGSQGRSFFGLAAYHLSGGGTYTIYIESPPASSNMVVLDDLLISSNNLHTGSYTIDTRKGETLPFNSPTVSDLTNRMIQIRDAFGDVHLQGTIP
jgi:hypothetical protein